jgi:glycosyltransferase involved in cell wall biosynthesis
VLPELDPKPLQPPFKLISVSRLAPNKRVSHAIRAIEVLRRRGIEAELTVVGGGEIEGRLRALPGELGIADIVRFTGPLPEDAKDAQLRGSHFLLHTSQREGWGLNVIEANAMGTPAAVYPVAGLMESTLDNETGVVSRAETPESLADRLVECFARPDDYQRWRRAAWKRAESFHWDNVLPQACEWLERQAGK